MKWAMKWAMNWAMEMAMKWAMKWAMEMDNGMGNGMVHFEKSQKYLKGSKQCYMELQNCLGTFERLRDLPGGT